MGAAVAGPRRPQRVQAGAAGARTVPEHLDQQVHEGREWLYVLAGTLRLALGNEDFLLGAGEAAEFDTRTPHAIANAGDRPLELLIIFGQQGQQTHLHSHTS